MLLDFAILGLGLFVLVRHKALARQQLQFQKEAFKLRSADEPRTIRASEVVYLIVGASAVLWAFARALGVSDR